MYLLCTIRLQPPSAISSPFTKILGLKPTFVGSRTLNNQLSLGHLVVALTLHLAFQAGGRGSKNNPIDQSVVVDVGLSNGRETLTRHERVDYVRSCQGPNLAYLHRSQSRLLGSKEQHSAFGILSQNTASVQTSICKRRFCTRKLEPLP